jgi:hypothetical protein
MYYKGNSLAEYRSRVFHSKRIVKALVAVGKVVAFIVVFTAMVATIPARSKRVTEISLLLAISVPVAASLYC